MIRLGAGVALVGLIAIRGPLPPPLPVQQASAEPCTRAVDDGFGTAKKTDLAIEGKIYYLPEHADKLPDFAKEQAHGSIYTDRWDVGPRDFTLGFPGVTDRFEWFAIDYQGSIYVPVAGEYLFQLWSDDGSRLYFDDKVVIDSDGIHGWDHVEGKVTLTQGDHRIRLSYFQGPQTEVGLRLMVTPPGSDVDRVFRLADFNKAVADSARLLGVSEDREEIRIRFGAEVLFDTAQFALKPVAEESLKQLALFLRTYPGYPIVIEGHTDSVGTEASNQVLSERRAESVRTWLVTQGRVAAPCITTKGFGMTQPVAENDTAEGRQKNRRVEIKIIKGG